MMVPRLVVIAQQVSDAQEEYQKARVTPGSISNLFYKDATPRAEHYIKVTVRLLGREQWPWHSPVPLRLVLCYDDGTPLDASDQSSLRVLSLSSHVSASLAPSPSHRLNRQPALSQVRAAIPAESDNVSFSYRIELGSFRRADRSFSVKIEACTDLGMDQLGDPQSTIVASLNGIVIEPALTPAVYVLSKKKLDGPCPRPAVAATPVSSLVGGKRKHDYYDEDSDDSGGRKVYARVPDTRSSTDDATEHIINRLDALEKSVSELATVMKSFVNHAVAMSPREVSGLAVYHDHHPPRSLGRVPLSLGHH